MKSYIALFLGVLLPILSFGQTPTWSEDVACIVYSHCSSCHNPTGIAPTSLLNYNDVYNQRYSIFHEVVTHKSMPPWQPNPNYSDIAHATYLSDAEIQTIEDWVNGAAPLGDTTLAPPTPVFGSNIEIQNPDFVAQLPSFTVPAMTGDMYKCFVVPTNFTQDQYVTAVEVIPSNLSVVHHVLVYADDSNIPTFLDQNDPTPGYTCFGSTGSNNSDLITGWVPGAKARFFPPNIGFKVSAGSNLVVQIHFPYGSTGEVDATKIHFKLSQNSNLRNVFTEPILNHVTSMVGGQLHIPANTVQTFHQKAYINYNASMISILPHAHLICTSMKAFGVKPNGDTIPFIDIPHWDFEWQGFYDFQRPIFVPQGTWIYGEATYDNTSMNPHNPNSPPQDVSVGDATTDEMMVFYFSGLGYQSGDENIIIDTSTHINHVAGCSGTVNTDEPTIPQINVNVLPNPSNGLFNFVIQNGERNAVYTIDIFDYTGKRIKSIETNYAQKIIDLTNVSSGIYFYQIRNSQQQLVKTDKILKY